MKNTIVIMGVMALFFAVATLSGCVETEEDPFVLCGKIEHMSSGNSWTRYDVLVMGGQYHAIYTCGEEAFAVMKYGFQNNCNVSVTIAHETLRDNLVITDAALLEC